jgi:hypothetical protein
MDLAGADGEIHPVQDRLVRHAGVEITDLKQNRGFRADHGGAGGADLNGRAANNRSGQMAETKRGTGMAGMER